MPLAGAQSPLLALSPEVIESVLHLLQLFGLFLLAGLR
jgi:hypothetical protein